MASFKILYQKNRNEKKPLKMVFDELDFYHQFFEEKPTVESVSKQKFKNELDQEGSGKIEWKS